MLPTPLILRLSLMGFGIATLSYPQSIKARQASSAQNVIYLGGTNNENDNLSTYCKPIAGINTPVSPLMDIYGITGNIPYGNIGITCYIGATGAPHTSVQRLFGNVFVNGFNFDLELNAGSQYYQYLISTLRSNFLGNSTNTYYITGAPQCPIPLRNPIWEFSTPVFDYLWIQFNSNNGYVPDPCSLGLPGDAPFSFNNWTSFIATTPSKNAKLFIGVPANTLAATSNAGGAVYYATPAQLASTDAGYSDVNVNNGCTYVQEAKNILLTGSPCGGSQPVSSSLPTTTAKPTKSATSTSSATGTVPQWGQCGGEGYTGPTQCIPLFKCVESSQWWSSCQ
ncbi:carbohydrate-binding module family 1 protein [Trichoderma compactum]